MRKCLYPLLASLFLLVGCAQDPHSRAVAIDPHGWSTDEPAVIHYSNSDTLSNRDIYFFVRYNETYRKCRFQCYVRTTAPDSTWTEELLEAVTGTDARFNGYREVVLPYRSSAVLGQRGCYNFVITPCEMVYGVAAIGVKMTETNNTDG